MSSESLDRPGGTPDLTREQVLAWRMHQHHLDLRKPEDRVVEVVQDICGLVARTKPGAELSLAARLRWLDLGTLQRLLEEDRSLVERWAMRGARYILPTETYGEWQAALRSCEWHQTARIEAWLELPRETQEAVRAAVADELRRGPLTRQELVERVVERADDTTIEDAILEHELPLLRSVAFAGELCMAGEGLDGPRFCHPDTWIGDYDTPTPQAGRRMVARQYLSANGPCSAAQFSRWVGVPTAAGREWLDALGEEVVPVRLDGIRYWSLRETVQEIERAQPTQAVRLLPEFDPYVVGAPRDEPPVVDPAYSEAVFDPAGWIAPTLVADGEVLGTWEYEFGDTDLVVTVDVFEEVPEWVRGEAWVEAVRLAEFADSDLVFNWRS